MRTDKLLPQLTADRKLLVAVAAGVLLVLVLLTITLRRPPAAETVTEKEFTAGRAMQIYIHNRGNDGILRSSDPAFAALSDTAAALLNSLEEALSSAGEWIEIGPDGLPPGSERPGNVIEDLKDNNVGVSLWYLEPVTFSTSIKAVDGQPADRHGYLVLTADRVLVLLGGPHRGLVLLRSDGRTNRYHAYRPGSEALRHMVEAVRNSAGDEPTQEMPLPEGFDLDVPGEEN